jgi:hypothetical protein
MEIASFFKKLFSSTKETVNKIMEQTETAIEEAKETATP